MSTSGAGGAGGGRPHGLSKFIRRASNVLKPESRRSSSNGATVDLMITTPTVSSSTGSRGPTVTSGNAQSSSQPRPATPHPNLSKTATSTPTNMPSQAQQATPTIPRRTSSLVTSPPKNATAHVKIQEDRARSTFAKYGMTLQAGEWTPAGKGDIEWVEKKVRMRVHRHCHRCGTTFGTDKICTSCAHTRCKKCPRTPTTQKSAKPAAEQALEIAIEPAVESPAVIHVDVDNVDSKLTQMHLSSIRTHRGNEMARKIPVQRVRRFCHKCDTTFKGKATECENCHHQRCPRCPREPPKHSKHGTAGYPGDVEETFPLAARHYRKPRTRVRWTCHTCSTTFVEHDRVCPSCAHDRCDDCSRYPPKKLKKTHPSDETLQKLVSTMVSKMDGMQLVSAAA